MTNSVLFFLNQGNTTRGVTFLFDGIIGNLDQKLEFIPEPEAAVLDTDNMWYYNYSPDNFNVTFETGGVGASLLDNQTSPKTIGNSSPTVSEFTKNIE